MDHGTKKKWTSNFNNNNKKKNKKKKKTKQLLNWRSLYVQCVFAFARNIVSTFGKHMQINNKASFLDV